MMFYRASHLKILHLITTLNVGGAETMLYRLLSHTNRERFRPVVVCLLDQGLLRQRIEALGVPVYSVKVRGLIDPAAWWRLNRLVKRVQPDLIQGWMYHGNLAALMAKTWQRRRIPTFWNVRQSLYNLGYEKRSTVMAIRLSAMLSFRPAKIIYNAHASAAHHEALGFRADKRIIIPNGFDTDQFRPSAKARCEMRAELGLSESTLLIGLIARFHPMKDHATFLQAAALLIQDHPDVHFFLVGRELEENNAITGLIHKLELKRYIHTLGERMDIPRVTAALDISTSSSYTEGFPNVIGEAMACGVPCVVTDVGDSALLVGDTGVAVPPRDPEALALAWSRLLGMGAEQRHKLGLAARARIVEHYALDSVVARYESLYTDTIAQKPNA